MGTCRAITQFPTKLAATVMSQCHTQHNIKDNKSRAAMNKINPYFLDHTVDFKSFAHAHAHVDRFLDKTRHPSNAALRPVTKIVARGCS